ncbi:MAG: hypothetical protein EOO18_10455 [Chryseobacterium sp.]|nr:MAG: hypothetical protein EOO18_10455 [Chryseobacterium sp.]
MDDDQDEDGYSVASPSAPQSHYSDAIDDTAVDASEVHDHDASSELVVFTDADRTDTYKQWLVRNVSITDNLATRYTYTIRANFKVTKIIYKSLKTSMFVNRLYNYEHPYYFLGSQIIRKAGNDPYFGMELNYNF